MTCPTCHGKGIIKCERCHGQGIIATSLAESNVASAKEQVKLSAQTVRALVKSNNIRLNQYPIY